VEIEKLISALEETVSFLQKSESSDWSAMPVEEIIRRLEAEVAKAKDLKLVDITLLDRLFAPTGVIQEISIDNGWGTKLLRIAEVVDEFTGTRSR
jgi:hypothetical protein